MQTNPIYIVLVAVFLLFMPVHTHSQEAPSPGASRTVLILNSYHPATKWSEEIVTEIKSALNAQYPGIHVYSGNLNVEEATTTGGLLLSLRAIIWQMAEQEGDTINPESMKKNSLYRIKKIPDVIVCVGEEAFYTHLAMHFWQGKWTDVPVVCCSLNDSISPRIWNPEQAVDLSNLLPAHDRKMNQVRIEINKNIAKSSEKSQAEIGLNFAEKAVRTPSGNFLYTSYYHTTGVLTEIPIRQNLELLRQLMPDLKEIVYVDNYYYKNAYALRKLRQEMPEIFPNVRFSVLINNRINTDSIYDAMLQPVKNRAFITYAMNFNGIYSRRAEQEIDSLFSHVLISPILTLSERQLDKNYWLGGAHYPTMPIVNATLSQINRIFNGEAADSIPYYHLFDPEIHLNVPALKRFGLEEKARQIEGVVYKNIPPTFYQQHEKVILISIILFILLTGAFILIIKHHRFTKKMQAESRNYRKLYKRLQMIYENSSINFALYDRQGILLFRIINGKENNKHNDTKDILSRNLYTNPYLSEETREQIRLRQTINEEVTTDGETGGKEKKRWNVIINPLNEASGQKASYMVVTVDLTPLIREQKAKEKAENIFRFASDTAGVGVASYNLLTGKIYASDTWYRNLNEEPTDTLPVYRNVCEEDRKLLLDYLESIQSACPASPFSETIRVKDSDGDIHYIREYIFAREYAPQRNVIAVVELNLNYDEPKQKANELQKAKENAEASNRETEQFLANISHEIRTPLNAIVGFSSILSTSTDEEEINSLAPIIEQNNDLLVELIDNILYLSKLDSGTLTFDYEPVAAEPLFDSLIAYGNEQIVSSGLTIIKDTPEASRRSQAPLSAEAPETGQSFLYIDETKFRLVMNNLISNAVKFTHHGKITVGYEKRENEYYYFVQDTGCGIQPEDQEKIFKRFEKLDAFTQGTGLGLALCRSIITRQQGNIGVCSTPGEGSTFWFTLPAGQSPEPQKSASSDQLQ